MNSKQTLYCYRNCTNSKLIQFAVKLTGVQIETVYLEGFTQNNINMLKERSQTGLFPVLRIGEFFLSGSIAITKYLLEKNETIHNVLFGTDSKRNALIQQWVDFTISNIWPFYNEIIGQITGSVEPHNEVYNIAVGDLLQVLTKINNHLTLRTFLVDHSMSFSDIVLANSLYPYFGLVLDKKARNTIPHLVRWFKYVSATKEVSSVLGLGRMCEIAQKPSQATKVEKLVPVKNIQPPQQKIQEKKEVKKEELKKPEVKKVQCQEESREAPKKTASNPLDLLPPTTLDIDAFKRDFYNTQEKIRSLNDMWGNYQADGWSVWHVYYKKSGDQGKILFKTCNLKSSFLQKLDKFRRYAFAVFGVYGEVPNLDVEGVWMWRGTEIPEEIKTHGAFDFLTIKKLDPTNENDKNLIHEYWLNVNEGDVVNGRKVIDAEYY